MILSYHSWASQSNNTKRSIRTRKVYKIWDDKKSLDNKSIPSNWFLFLIYLICLAISINYLITDFWWELEWFISDSRQKKTTKTTNEINQKQKNKKHYIHHCFAFFDITLLIVIFIQEFRFFFLEKQTLELAVTGFFFNFKSSHNDLKASKLKK